MKSVAGFLVSFPDDEDERCRMRVVQGAHSVSAPLRAHSFTDPRASTFQRAGPGARRICRRAPLQHQRSLT